MRDKTRYICGLMGMVMIIFSRCKNERDFTIKGRLLLSCDSAIPVADARIYLDSERENKGGIGNCDYGKISSTITDAEGNFVLTYFRCCFGQVSVIYEKDFEERTLVYLLKSNDEYELGDVYLKNNTFYFYKIETDTPYTNNDTLVYDIQYIWDRGGVKDSSYKFRTGPFITGTALDTFNVTVPVANPNFYNGLVEARWLLKSGSVVHKTSNFQVPVVPCKKYNEVVFDLSK